MASPLFPDLPAWKAKLIVEDPIWAEACANTVSAFSPKNSFSNQPYQHKDANEAGFLRPSFAVANDNGVRFISDDGSALDFVRQLRDPLPVSDTVPVAADSRDDEPVNTEDPTETEER